MPPSPFYRVPDVSGVADRVRSILPKPSFTREQQENSVEIPHRLLEDWYNELNERVHLMDDDGSGTVQLLIELRDDIYHFLY